MSKPMSKRMSKQQPKLRSRAWFDNPDNPAMTSLYIERYQNQGYTLDELQCGKPMIGIAQTGSDLAPCNKIHVLLADRIKAGIRDADGIPIEFPVHPIQETGKRPPAALDRNLAYLGLVEVLHGYPIDGVVLTTGCDKTTPAQLMAATVDIPAICLNGGQCSMAGGAASWSGPALSFGKAGDCWRQAKLIMMNLSIGCARRRRRLVIATPWALPQP